MMRNDDKHQKNQQGAMNHWELDRKMLTLGDKEAVVVSPLINPNK
jgi:hypothetical protein